MADLVDNVVDFTEEVLRQHNNKIQAEVPRGRCLNCTTPIPSGLYCDDDCREDFEHRQRVIKRTSR